MFKKDFGISLYPEKTDWNSIKHYLIKANECGFKRLFLSWFQVKDNDKNQKLYFDTIKLAKELGFYITIDIHDNNFKFYEDLGVNCVRLDAPVSPYEVAAYTYETNLDFQLNMSGVSHYLESVLDSDPVRENIYGCHNFYPQIKTGLSWDFFNQCTQKFVDLGIHTSAFVNSQNGTDGPQKFKLEGGVTTIEELRFLPIRTQVKYLLATKKINSVYIGNQFASVEELESFVEIDTKNIELDIELVRADLQPLEKEILMAKQHRRGDINENFIRSSEHRVVYQNREDILPISSEKAIKFFKGGVVITNSKNKNYPKELHLILQDVTLTNCQMVAKVKDYDLGLIDFIGPEGHFKFKIV